MGENLKRSRSIWSAVLAVALSAFLIACAIGGSFARAGTEPTPRAITASIDPGDDAARLSVGAGSVRVSIALRSNRLLTGLESERPELTGRMSGAAAARRAALRSPKTITPDERDVGRRMERQRNRALVQVRALADVDTQQSEDLQRVIENVGGVVHETIPMPNSIVATVPRSFVLELAKRREVVGIAEAGLVRPSASVVEGSPTWHANGFNGQGSSADGNGGPDYGVFDMGVRTTHNSFKSRQVADCSTCIGSGPTRIVSPAGRSDFSGSEHGNQIAATVASTDLTTSDRAGQAFGIDSVYDEYQAKSSWRWLIGVAYQGEPGITDLTEAVNFSAGIYENTVDMNAGWAGVDAMVANMGTTWTISAGNCGIATLSFTGCDDGPHRVSTPGNLPNTITVGGIDPPGSIDPNTWTYWANSSPGPTWGGRKKPDLVAKVTGATSCPNDQDDTTFENCGTGTSYAAPQAAGGALLLASVGVYAPTAQKAILINSARPIQGQTYWSPLTGWGALNNEGAFNDRANYANGAVTAAGANSTRFYSQSGVGVGDRTTLVWNRRIGTYTGANSPAYSTMTDLDLIQIASADACSPNCTPTASGGSDAADTVDTNQTVSAANPMPGNGTDGVDNVEQVRSTATGTQVFKVKAMSTIDGASNEDYSIAGSQPVEALETPIPNVNLAIADDVAGVGDAVNVSATVTNPSDDLALSGASVTLSVPSGVSITAGTPTQSAGTIAANGNTVINWQVTGSSDGLKSLTAQANGTTYGEPFAGEGSDAFTVDATAPVTSVGSLPEWSITNPVAFTWSAVDAHSSVASHDVETSVAGGPFTPLLTSTTSTSSQASGIEGAQLQVRVRSRDPYGNESGWTTSATTIDAIAPVVAIGSSSSSVRGSISVPVSVTNVGVGVTATYTFGVGQTASKPLSGAATYVNGSAARQSPVLIVTATDALGRSVSASQVFSVEPRFALSNLRIRSAKASRGKLTVAGSASTSVAGRATVTARRIGKRGTKRVVKRLVIKSGKFRGSLKLRPGRYKLTVTTAGNSTVIAGSVSKTVRVK